MDERTLATYDRDAAAFAHEWDAQPASSDMHALIRRFFKPGPTADIGCGSGRDTAWLDRNGFSAVGYDASAGLLDQARRLHPTIRFQTASLPALEAIADDSFTNVFCETVIMHLEHVQIAPSVERLMAILKPGGTLYLTWRVTQGADKRDDQDRLYAAFDPSLVSQALGAAEVLLDEERDSASSGKLIHRIVARKPSILTAG